MNDSNLQSAVAASQTPASECTALTSTAIASTALTNAAAEQTAQQRKSYYAAIKDQQLFPLWEVLHSLVPQQPNSPCVPAHWAYTNVRPKLMESGSLITAQEAIRRVLILENPGLAGSCAITQSLYAGLQLILPGEVAPAHRHTQSALRFIVEGEGAYTAVNGERTTMREGDFIITPSWTWHDHGHEQKDPVVWLDGLDIPMIRFFDAGFAENAAQDSQIVERPEGATDSLYSHGLAPVKARHQSATSPIFNYPYARTRDVLYRLSRNEAPDSKHGYLLKYVNPLTGQWAIPTMATFMQWCPKGFASQPSQSTDGRIFSVVEGSGVARIKSAQGQEYSFNLARRDVFVVPSWANLELIASQDLILFSYSDRPVQEAMGVWRERQ
jgi:gentisate 1,2-dioxygenase